VPLASDDVSRVVQEQMASIADPVVREGLTRILIPPEHHLRNWDYGWPGERLACWTLAVHRQLERSLVYCERGFGPTLPWGLVHATNLWFGKQSDWYRSLRDCFLDSWAAGYLPIWQVVKNPSSANVEIVHSDLGLDRAIKLQEVLMRTARGAKFTVLARRDSAATMTPHDE
jgi:hypothetical protein